MPRFVMPSSRISWYVTPVTAPPALPGPGLDAHAVLRVPDHGVEDAHVADGVVAAPAHAPDAEPVPADARPVGKGDAPARVNGQAVVLVVHPRVGDCHVGRVAHVERVRVVAQAAPAGAARVAP